jgi:hypothetical protein
MSAGRLPTPVQPSNLLSRRRPPSRWAIALVVLSLALFALAAALLGASLG